MQPYGETETESMDSPLVEFEDVVLPDGTVASVGPEVVFLGIGSQVRWGNALARLGVCFDRDRMIWRAQHGDRFFVSTTTGEHVGDIAELAGNDVLTLIEQPVPGADSGTRHSIAWDEITRVGIVAGVTGSPKCA
jgi:hypothetical protein